MASVDWQSKKTLADSNLHMLEHETDCDVTFLVGGKKETMKAHRFMLVSRSCVFEAMLTGQMAETSEAIAIPDIEKDIFTTFLRFMYTEKISLNPDNVMAILYAAKKYGVTALVEECKKFLKDNISTESVCTILNQVHTFDEDELAKACLDYIFFNGEEVLKTEGFLALHQTCLEGLVESDRLRADEVTIYKSCVGWAKEECKRRDLDLEKTNCRTVFENTLYNIRFPVMEIGSFSRDVVDDNILTAEETIAIFQYYGTGDVERLRGMGFVTEKRSGFRFGECLAVERFARSPCPESSIWTYSGLADAISFSCSEDLSLIGVMLYLPVRVSSVLSGQIRVEENGEIIAKKDVTLRGSDNDITESVMFDTPISVQKSRRYVIMQQCTGSNSRNGVNGVESVVLHGITFSFYDWVGQSRTNVSAGQIPCLLFR